MDLVFNLGNGDRVSYLLNLMHSFGSSYICLWSYNPDINLLYCEDGHFQEQVLSIAQVASSSSTSLARERFEKYKHSAFIVGNQSLIPGLAFKNRKAYVELQEVDLQRFASNEDQRHFYLDARIKMAVFLGCDRGEIELGMPYIPQNLEIRMQNLLSQDYTRLQTSQAMEVPRLIDQSRPSPSSSYQSIDSPDYSQLFYNLPSTTSYLQETPSIVQQSTTKAHQTIPMPVLNQLLNIPFPTQETTDDALTRAYLAILSSTSSLESQPSINRTPQSNVENQVHQRTSAFKSYNPSLGINTRSNLRRQSLFKRVISYYRGINYIRVHEHSSVHGTRPSSTQLHHMISERRRREKINDSFQALRSMLPQGTKKDKASVLRTTKEYLSSLKTQLSDLSKRNQELESQLKMKKETTATTIIQEDLFTNERLSVQIIPVLESTSSERLVDLHVRLRGDSAMVDIIMRLSNFIKQSRETSIISLEAQTSQQRVREDQTLSMDVVIFRLSIEGNEWDESSFKEAVRRILANLGQPQLNK